MSDVTNKPVIFLAFANARDDTVDFLRNLADEKRRLRRVLELAEQDGLCEVVIRSDCTAGDIFEVFQKRDYRDRIAVFHYGGHANGYQLLLESAAGEAAAADAGGLARFLGQQKGLHLVFLNGCSTQLQTQGLLDANISAVISTSQSILDEVAADFSYQFYQWRQVTVQRRTIPDSVLSRQTKRSGLRQFQRLLNAYEGNWMNDEVLVRDRIPKPVHVAMTPNTTITISAIADRIRRECV